MKLANQAVITGGIALLVGVVATLFLSNSADNKARNKQTVSLSTARTRVPEEPLFTSDPPKTQDNGSFGSNASSSPYHVQTRTTANIPVNKTPTQVAAAFNPVTPSLRQTATYVATRANRRITNREFNGEFLILDDRSIWGVHSLDRINFYGYENVTVVKQDQPADWEYNHIFVDSTNNGGMRKTAKVKLVGQAVLPPAFRGEHFSIIAGDGTFLGTLSQNPTDSKSVLNPVGSYGSSVSSTSIFNSVGKYGSSVSNYSAFNTVASEPQRLVTTNGTIAYLTVNSVKSPAIDAKILVLFLKTAK